MGVGSGQGGRRARIAAVVRQLRLLAFSGLRCKGRGPRASVSPARGHDASLATAAAAGASSSRFGGSDRADQPVPSAGGDDRAGDPRDDAWPIPMVDGRPMWAANKRHTAEENARYQFARDGGPISAPRDVERFRRPKAHAFVERIRRSGSETPDTAATATS